MSQSNLEVAKTILAQLGGRRFTTMTGAKDFGGGENYLMFRLPRGFAKDGINKIKITLHWTDTYILEAYKITSRPVWKAEVVAKVDNVYADNLQKVFSEVTGLDTHL